MYIPLFTGFILLYFLVIAVINNYKRKSKAAKLINAKNEEISHQKIADLLKEQKLKSFQSRLDGQITERKRISKELHDGVGGSLAAIKLNLLKINRNNLDNLETIIENLDMTCREVRTVSHNLVPPEFTEQFFTEVVRNFIQQMFSGEDIEVNLELFPEVGFNEISQNYQIDLYRIIQELVTNISKHAKASRIDIELTLHDNYINLIIEDNGVGFVQYQNSGGIGINNVKSRINDLGGDFHIESILSKGTSININIPLTTNKIGI